MALYTFYLQGHADEEKSETEESCCQEDRMAGGQLHIYLKVNGYIILGKKSASCWQPVAGVKWPCVILWLPA